MGTYVDTTQADSTTASRYSWSKIKGDDGMTFFMVPYYAPNFKRSYNGTFNVNTIRATAYYRQGENTARTTYAKAAWVIATSTNGSTWTDIYDDRAKAADDRSATLFCYIKGQAKGATYTASTKLTDTNSTSNRFNIDWNVSHFRVRMYSETNVLLDEQVMPVYMDAASMTQEQIFKLLTNDGAIKGIYQEGNQLYINASYIKTGTLKVGGSDNTYGSIALYDQSGNEVGSFDKDGLKLIHNNEYGAYQMQYSMDGILYKKGNSNLVQMDIEYIDYIDPDTLNSYYDHANFKLTAQQLQLASQDGRPLELGFYRYSDFDNLVYPYTFEINRANFSVPFTASQLHARNGYSGNFTVKGRNDNELKLYFTDGILTDLVS